MPVRRQQPACGVVRHTWTVAEAKAKLSEVIAQASSSGTQIITRRGRPAAVMISPKEWSRYSRPPGGVAKAIQAARGLGPLPEREKVPWTAAPL